MSVSEAKRETFYQTSHNTQELIRKYSEQGTKEFKKISRFYLLFHFGMSALLILEILAFVVLLGLLPQSPFIALLLALFVLSVFSYVILIYYFQAKKPQQFSELKKWFLLLSRQALPKEMALREQHLMIANAVYQFAVNLHEVEYAFLNLEGKLDSFSIGIKKIHRLFQKHDLRHVKEILLLAAIEEHMRLIKHEPTDLEAHASLANTYIAFSRLYLPPSSDLQEIHEYDFIDEVSKEKFSFAVHQALEEFRIIDAYAPNDPWVHAQLASCYHDLEQIEKEIAEYETILSLCPSDKKILFRLGILYFQKGENAKGLKIYEELKRLHYSKADDLIQFYDINLKEFFFA